MLFTKVEPNLKALPIVKMKHIRRVFREHYPQWEETFREYFKDMRNIN